MDNAQLQQALFWMADNIRVWAGTVVMVLAAFIIGLLHLVAATIKE